MDASQVSNDGRVAQIEEDPHAVDVSAALGDTAVAQVEAEEVEVLGRQRGQLVSFAPAPSACRRWEPVGGSTRVPRHLPGVPVPNRSPRHPEPRSRFGRPQTLFVSKPQCLGHRRPAVHQRTSDAGGGNRTHTLLRATGSEPMLSTWFQHTRWAKKSSGSICIGGLVAWGRTYVRSFPSQPDRIERPNPSATLPDRGTCPHRLVA